MSNDKYRVADTEFSFFVIRGTVKAANSSSDVRYYEGYSSAVGGTVLSSRKYDETAFQFIADEGKEIYASLDVVMPVLPGHRVSVLYCRKPGSEQGLPVAVRNETLDKISVSTPKGFNDSFSAISSAGVNTRLGFGCFTFIVCGAGALSALGSKHSTVLTALSWLCGLALLYLMFEGLIGVHIWSSMKTSRVQSDLNDAAKKFLQG